MTTDWQEIAQQLRERNAAQAVELTELRAQLAGDTPAALSALQQRCHRQRVALDRLNRKVLTQRFRLNLLRTLGRDVSFEEYRTARDAAGNERIAEYEVLV